MAAGVAHGEAVRALAHRLGDRATTGKPLGPLTTYGVGGPAALFVEVERPADLEAFQSAVRDVVGEDRGGTAAPGSSSWDAARTCSSRTAASTGWWCISARASPDWSCPTGATRRPRQGPRGRRWCGPGRALALPVLARRVADAGWSGLSWAVGVPGSVGGAVRMNAGGHGSDMAACLARYSWVDLVGEDGGTDDVARLAYGYRTSSVTPTQLVVQAELVVTPGSAEEERAAVSSIVSLAPRAPTRRKSTPAPSSPIRRVTRPAG